ATLEKKLPLLEVIKPVPVPSAAGVQGPVQQISSANILPVTGVVESMALYLLAGLTSLFAYLMFKKKEEV
ncbi:TPA: LPXTG cell wall anchor domain-containing protein, partial [Streptococcus suis]